MLQVLAGTWKESGESPPHRIGGGGSFLSGISSAGATCAVFPGPSQGRGSAHTYCRKRAVCLLVKLRALPSLCQLAATQSGNQAELARELLGYQPLSPSPILLFVDLDSTLLELFCKETKLYVPP